jgi:hypothetical protein
MRIDSDPANLASARKAVEALTAKWGFDEKDVNDVGSLPETRRWPT